MILDAFDRIAHLRDAGRAIVSGFHTPVEKECLRILLSGASSIVVCPARSLDRLRIPSDWKPALAAGRLLLVLPLAHGSASATADLAQSRNEFVTAFATEILVLHAGPGGCPASLVGKLERAGRQAMRFQAENQELMAGIVIGIIHGMFC